jgi:hypothetical protein
MAPFEQLRDVLALATGNGLGEPATIRDRLRNPD